MLNLCCGEGGKLAVFAVLCKQYLGVGTGILHELGG